MNAQNFKMYAYQMLDFIKKDPLLIYVSGVVTGIGLSYSGFLAGIGLGSGVIYIYLNKFNIN